MTEIPNWHITGDWFDNCSCAVACPCTFAQAPDNGFCESVLFWHVRSGHYGDITLDDLSGGRARVGVSDHAQESMGDVVFVEVPDLGKTVAAKNLAAAILPCGAAGAPAAGGFTSVVSCTMLASTFRIGELALDSTSSAPASCSMVPKVGTSRSFSTSSHAVTYSRS